MKKVKRKRINWFLVLARLDNAEYFRYFFSLVKKLHCGKSISSNRAAYSTLKHFYSTTTIAELAGKLNV